ncbi:hypothetical protein [Chromohalobacter nigrandesensis]|uniref:hypothetical protein n=1 Tax=Chromohalobacter nigrandesensis TaxID=119863 RepID=UPI001FF474A0|nr:hypothetical protein [Chromohalobacter nigrandesensis]MCK0745016.1 hypothetical protein [Chromohalobacter nigrandesensis]
MGGGSSSSSSDKTYNTTNVSQQAEGANVYGKGNRVLVQRADAVTLDNIAKALESGTKEITGNAAEMSDGAFDLADEIAQTSRDINRDSLEFAEGINVDSLDMADSVNRDSLDFADGVNSDSLGLAGDALTGMQQLAREVAQAGENGTQRAMDFVSDYTQREQVGNAGDATKTVIYVAAFASVALVGIAWASKRG